MPGRRPRRHPGLNWFLSMWRTSGSSLKDQTPHPRRGLRVGTHLLVPLLQDGGPQPLSATPVELPPRCQPGEPGEPSGTHHLVLRCQTLFSLLSSCNRMHLHNYYDTNTLQIKISTLHRKNVSSMFHHIPNRLIMTVLACWEQTVFFNNSEASVPKSSFYVFLFFFLNILARA